MAERTPTRLLAMRALYVALALAVMFLHLLPLNTAPGRWAGPDLLVALTFAWVMRRPEQVPAPAVAAVMLLADLLFQRPPGLMAALVLMGAEYARNRRLAAGEIGLAREWLMVALILTAIFVADRVALSLLAVPQAQLSLGLMRLGLTVATYPLVVLFARAVLGLRRAAPGDGAAAGGQG